MSGKVTLSSEASELVLVENLKQAVPLLESAGITGLIEPINGHFLPGYFLDDFHTGGSTMFLKFSASNVFLSRRTGRGRSQQPICQAST